MQKGQVSFDFILAIIVALIFIGGMQLLNAEMQEMQKAAAVRNQEKLIALELYRIISTASALGDADNLEIQYKTQKILVPEERTLQECSIDLSAGEISYNLDGETIRVDIPEFNDAGLTRSDQIDCGDILEIS